MTKLLKKLAAGKTMFFPLGGKTLAVSPLFLARQASLQPSGSSTSIPKMRWNYRGWSVFWWSFPFWLQVPKLNFYCIIWAPPPKCWTKPRFFLIFGLETDITRPPPILPNRLILSFFPPFWMVLVCNSQTISANIIFTRVFVTAMFSQVQNVDFFCILSHTCGKKFSTFIRLVV